MDTTTLQILEPPSSAIFDELDLTRVQEALPNIITELIHDMLAALYHRLATLSLPIILNNNVTSKSGVPVEEDLWELVCTAQMHVQLLKRHQNLLSYERSFESAEDELQALCTTLFCETAACLRVKFKVVCSFITDFIPPFRHALVNFDRLRLSYGAVYIQNAKRPLTEEEKKSHLLSFDDFLETTLFILTAKDIDDDYARWMRPASPSDPHEIRIRPSLWNALLDKRHPCLVLLFFACLAHELGHAYRYVVQKRVRRGSHGSTDTPPECAVGDQHGIERGVEVGESGYVVEHMWLGGTLKCLVEKHKEPNDWHGDWVNQWSYFEEFHILDEEANKGRKEEEWVTRRIDNEEVERFVGCLMNKQDPGKLRLGAELPHQPQYYRRRSSSSQKGKPSRSDAIDWNKYMLVDAVRCGHSSCRKDV